jgi:hypothetical protein
MRMLVTQKEYARRRRCTPQYINKLVHTGKIVLVNGRVDVKKADAALQAWQRHGRSKPGKSISAISHRSPRASRAEPRRSAEKKQKSATRSLTEARAEREHYAALAAKLDYEKATGELLPRDQVLEAERRKNANIRTRFRRLARSLAPVLAQTSSPGEVERVLLEEIDYQLRELASDPLGLAVEVPVVQAPAEIIQPPAAPAEERPQA